MAPRSARPAPGAHRPLQVSPVGLRQHRRAQRRQRAVDALPGPGLRTTKHPRDLVDRVSGRRWLGASRSSAASRSTLSAHLSDAVVSARTSGKRSTLHHRERRALRHSLATIARNHGRSGAPARNCPSFRQASNAASCTASSAAALSFNIVIASRNAGSSTGASKSSKARPSPALVSSSRLASSSLTRPTGSTRESHPLLRSEQNRASPELEICR